MKEELSVQHGVQHIVSRTNSFQIHSILRFFPEYTAVTSVARLYTSMEKLYWVAMRSKIKDFLSKCTTCNEYAIGQ